jgi:1,4-dihydroxy-2-naphthoyl-CoA synthase
VSASHWVVEKEGIFATEDAREGPKAFAQKRKPNSKAR